MATPSNVIRVPKPAAGAFNPARPLAKNTLLLNQVKHFHRLELDLPVDRRTGIALETIQTEGQASEYIRKMTAILHPQAAGSGAK